MPVDERGRVDRPPRELRGEVFRRFLEALEPLRRAGKLGGILFQLPQYVVYKEASLDYLEWAREQLGGDEMLVEFRHRSWLDDENRAASLAFLERIGASYVTVDAPRSETARNLVPTVVAATGPTAYVRFHGRNLGTWNKRGGSAAERFDYLYSDEELAEWTGPLRELAGQTERDVRVLQQQRHRRGSREPARAHLPGGDERGPAAAASRREPHPRHRLVRGLDSADARPLDRPRARGADRALRAGRRRAGPRARRVELRVGHAAAAAARVLRRGARLRRRDARRPGRPASVAARRDGVAAAAARARSAGARDLPRRAAPCPGGAARGSGRCRSRRSAGPRSS